MAREASADALGADKAVELRRRAFRAGVGGLKPTTTANRNPTKHQSHQKKNKKMTQRTYMSEQTSDFSAPPCEQSRRATAPRGRRLKRRSPRRAGGPTTLNQTRTRTVK